MLLAAGMVCRSAAYGGKLFKTKNPACGVLCFIDIRAARKACRSLLDIRVAREACRSLLDIRVARKACRSLFNFPMS